MRKLKLDLDELAVESFETTVPEPKQGTIVGNQQFGPGNPGISQYLGTCGRSCLMCVPDVGTWWDSCTCQTCAGQTCDGPTCFATCYGTCLLTCAGNTCGGTCYLTCYLTCHASCAGTCHSCHPLCTLYISCPGCTPGVFHG
jgi:hypothetical protein